MQVAAGAVSGDVFDRAIMKGLGVSIQESASSSGKVYVANNPHIQEYLQIACSSKAGAKLLDDIPFCSKVKYASRMFNVRVDSSSRCVHLLCNLIWSGSRRLSSLMCHIENQNYV